MSWVYIIVFYIFSFNLIVIVDTFNVTKLYLKLVNVSHYYKMIFFKTLVIFYVKCEAARYLLRILNNNWTRKALRRNLTQIAWQVDILLGEFLLQLITNEVDFLPGCLHTKIIWDTSQNINVSLVLIFMVKQSRCKV